MRVSIGRRDAVPVVDDSSLECQRFDGAEYRLRDPRD